MIYFNKIYNTDCMKGMQFLIESNIKFDLIITSPPYNLGGDFHTMGKNGRITYGDYSKYKDKKNEEQYQLWQIDCLNLMYELLKEDGSLWYNHKNRISKGRTISPLEWLSKTDFILKQDITWNQKKGANVDKCRCFPFSEKIYWLTKSPKVKIHNKNNFTDVWDIVPKTNRKKMGHPAVMELEVVERIYSFYEDKEDLLVFDPFAGTATTFLPIKDKYQWIGFESDEKYVEIAINRLRPH